MRLRVFLLHAFTVVAFSVPLTWSEVLPPSHLRCEYLTNPAAVDVLAPRFAWILNHTGRAQRQTAYEIQVSRTPAFTSGMVWDSRKVPSDDSIQVEYKGQPLASDSDYYWRVRYWDANDTESPWSEPASFSTGLLQQSDWKAKWIGGGNLLRKPFALAMRVKRARMFIGAAGYYELHINGHRIGDHVLDPAWTDYSKRVLYSTYDVTNDLQPGRNAMAALLGRAWYSKTFNKDPLLICELRGEYQDGTPFLIISDQTWEAFQSPIVMDDIYNGETYDARLEKRGWDTSDFQEKGKPATAAEMPGVVLSSQMMPAIKIVDTLIPHKMVEAAPGMYVYDFEQNFSGWVKIKVRGPAGKRVRIRYSELVNPDGSLMVDNLRTARSTDTYIPRGDPNGEEYEAHFTYHGFRTPRLAGFPVFPP